MDKLYKIGIELDQSGTNSDWHADRIELADERNHMTTFKYNKWLKANNVYESGTFILHAGKISFWKKYFGNLQL